MYTYTHNNVLTNYRYLIVIVDIIVISNPTIYTDYYCVSSSTIVTMTSTPEGSGGNGRKRKAGTPHHGAPGEKVARAPKKCDRKACEIINADPFCFVRATDK